MHDVPDCLNRRYKALDELIQDLSAVVSSRSHERNRTNDPGIKLMCEFWSILKADPDCNLALAVKKRMGVRTSNSSMFGPRQFSCYMAQEDRDDDNVSRSSTKKKDKSKNQTTEACFKKTICCAPDPNKDSKICCEGPISLASLSKGSLPLNKVLCNLKEAASYDKKCNDRITELMETQNELREQIQTLEQREKDGAQLLKQADCMWSCMEESYKKKLESSQKRQQDLMKQLKEVETNNAKWRKNKKDLEFQMNSLNKCHKEITEKLAQKANDVTCLDTEISSFQKRVDNNKKEIDNIKKTSCGKKCAADKKLYNLSTEVTRLTSMLSEEKRLKRKKEDEGTQFVKEARDDLQKICRLLLQKKLENEDLKAEKDALREEIELLNQAMDHCKEKCGKKHEKIKEDIKNIDKEIANFKFKCVQCHQCVDTSDVRKMCTDCPRCIQERECITYADDEHCELDPTMDCVCMDVKQKFLDNVFENMYTVLSRQATTKPGKAVAEAIVRCLRRSRNGKLNEETKKILQDFILSTVKKNLTLTIIGGAVKTRCEMDPDTYNQLMLCLKQVKAVKPPKEDKSTAVKKESCRRWGGTSECNCPKGPKACVCTKKAPPPPDDKDPIPPPDPADLGPGEVIQCPHKESTACGPDCGMRTPNAVDTEVSWKREPCKPPCAFSTNMRAAQCMLGPEPLPNNKNFKTRAPVLPPRAFADLTNNSFKYRPPQHIVCKPDRRSRPRERIIEEVMGKYTEVSSLEKVASTNKRSKVKKMDKTTRCVCSKSKSKKISPATSKLSPNPTIECPSGWLLLEGTDALREMLIKKRVTYICKTGQECPIIEPEIDKSSESEVSNGSKNNRDARLTVLLHPRFRPAPKHNKTDNNRSVCESISYNLSANNNDYAKSISECKISKNEGNSLFCDIAKQLISDMIVPDINEKENIDPNVEWMTVDSFLNQITSGAESHKDNISNVTNEEIEIIKCPLDVKQFGNKLMNTERTKSMRIKVSNSTVKKCIPRSAQVVIKHEKQAKVRNADFSNEIKHADILTNHTRNDQVKLKDKETVKVKPHISNELFSNENYTGLDNGNDIIKVAAKTESIDPGYSFTNLTNTSSGNFAMMINDKILDIIDKKASTDPNLAITLNTRESGYIKLNLHSDASIVDENLSAVLTRSASGHRQLEVSSGFTQLLNLNSKKISSHIDNPSLYERLEKIDEQTGVNESDKPKYSKTDAKQKEDLISSSLNKKFNERGIIKLKIYGENGVSKDIDVPLTKTLSGNIAVDINKLSSLGDIELNFKERPVILRKSNSSTFILYITKNVDESNAMIRNTASGNLLVLPKRPTFITTEIGVKTPKEKIYVLKIKDNQTFIEDPLFVLKPTSSKNYVVVVDKEYETQYKKTIDKYVGSNTGCNVNMTLTNSGNCQVNINDDDYKNNARLLKSDSGILKIIPNLSNNNSSSLKTNRRESKVYSDLLRKLSEPSKYILKESQNAIKPYIRKSVSDSNLLQMVKILTPDLKDLLQESSVELKKTKGGQYAVVLDKTSKKSLINNLKAYLSKNNSQGLIPVRKTNYGEIIIALGNEQRTCSQFGSLKITTSGNIYLLVDEKSAEIFSQNKEIDMENDDANSSHFIEKVKHPVDKLITTTCNGQPDSCCDLSHCICKQVKFKDSGNVCFLTDTELEDSKTILSFSITNIDTKGFKKRNNNQEESSKDRNDKKVTENNSQELVTNRKVKVPTHIVIKPQQPRAIIPRAEEQCYFVTSVCPHHIGRYDSLSNELIEINGPCAQSLDDSKEADVNHTEIKKLDWDSIEQLPHQLPAFLRGFNTS